MLLVEGSVHRFRNIPNFGGNVFIGGVEVMQVRVLKGWKSGGYVKCGKIRTQPKPKR